MSEQQTENLSGEFNEQRFKSAGDPKVDAFLKRFCDKHASVYDPTLQPPNPDCSPLKLIQDGQHNGRIKVVIVSCSDSRANGSTVLRTKFGEAFLLTSPGGVVKNFRSGNRYEPPVGTSDKWMGLNYALGNLDIDTVIHIGHTECGVMNAMAEQAHGSAKQNNETEPYENIMLKTIYYLEEGARREFFERNNGRRPNEAELARSMAYQNVRISTGLIEDFVGTYFKDRKIKVIGLLYDLTNGHLEKLLPNGDFEKITFMPTSAEYQSLSSNDKRDNVYDEGQGVYKRLFPFFPRESSSCAHCSP